MLSFVKNYMVTIEGIEIYPIISMSIFFAFFGLLFFWVCKSKKEYIDKVTNLPFEK